MLEAQNAKKLYDDGKLNGEVWLWGIGKKTEPLIGELSQLVPELEIKGIIDNFKHTFLKNYAGLSVNPFSCILGKNKDDICVLLAVHMSAGIKRQLTAIGIKRFYDLENPEENAEPKKLDLPYTFVDRSQGKENLCYILAGYLEDVWDTTLERMSYFANDSFDYCVISSGLYSERIDSFCERNGWSYLYSLKNQICFLQNLVIQLHPKAQYFIKLDEDIFIGRHFYEDMLREYKETESNGEYRIGALVPVLQVGFSGYVSYLKAIGRLEDYEKQFGRAYRCVFCGPYGTADATVFLWDTISSFDETAEWFRGRKERPLCSGCQINIGAVMYSRERWLMMGRWPENENSSGMGEDENTLWYDGAENGMVLYEAQNILVGHFAFSGQKERMLKYYREKHTKFEIKD